MNADSQVEKVFSCVLDHVLVGLDTGSFQSFRAELFSFQGDDVGAERESVSVDLSGTSIVDTDLRVRYTTAEPGLWERLVLAVSVASSGSSSHGCASN